ncbi:MAG TPA: hypothetical protein VGZ26_02550 [Pirellulales bacterium]|nr:hypothetical protein [Pirellulales bacterium]
MGSKSSGFVAAVLLGLTMLSSVGCVGLAGPNLGVFGVPIPISPYWMDKKEDEYWVKERYDRVPILGPLTSGGPVVALDPPSDDEIMRALERAHPIEGGFPLLHEVQRSNVRIVKTKIGDYVDPPRFYPLVGPAQQHHAHYKCTIYYTQITRIGWPVPHTLKDEDSQEVIYVDHNHFHMVGNVETGVQSQF